MMKNENVIKKAIQQIELDIRKLNTELEKNISSSENVGDSLSEIKSQLLTFLHLSFGKTYFANKNHENAVPHLKNALKYANNTKMNQIIIEINMILGVIFLKIDDYEAADEYFMTCYPLQERENKEEIGDVIWPWKEIEYGPAVEFKDRIELYKFIYPYFDHIKPSEYFDFLVFQLRCNESMKVIRKGQYNKSLHQFLALFYNCKDLKNIEISELRIKFRKTKKHRLDVQVFDYGTLFHYLALSYWHVSDFENAIINFEESISYREKNGYHLDLVGSYNNLGEIYSEKREFSKAISFIEKSLQTQFNNDTNKNTITTLLMLARLKLNQHNFQHAIRFAEKAKKLSEDMQLEETLVKSLFLLGRIHSCDNQPELAIKNFEKIHLMTTKIENKIVSNYSKYFMVLSFNKIGDFDRSEALMQDIKFTSDQNLIDANIEILYLLSIIDYKLSLQLPVNYKICKILISNILSGRMNPYFLETALMQLLKIDLIFGDNLIYDEISSIGSKLLERKNPFIIAYLIMKELVYGNNTYEIDELIEEIEILLETSLDKKELEDKFSYIYHLDDFSPKELIDITNGLIGEGFIFSIIELKVDK